MRKVTMIGGGGVRTPLLIHGLAQSQALLDISEMVLYDVDAERAEIVARLGREIVRRLGAAFEIRTAQRLEEAAEGATFVLSSIRVGGISGRARDERLAVEHGLAGQETTGPAGAAMALRTLPVALAQARVVERVATHAWFINFTNPAGLITQALTDTTGLKVIGICDTPTELFHRIADAIGEPYGKLEFDYAGLNHLGWIRSVKLRGVDITGRLLADAPLLRQLYPADLFDPALIQTLRLIPTEYLFFYYSQRRAHRNQVRAAATRGEELERMNAGLFRELGGASPAEALAAYRAYLMRRNASYMTLESQAQSAFGAPLAEHDPFETATGYHRIALDVMTALAGETASEVVVNVPNQGTIEDLEPGDVVEVPCDIDGAGARPRHIGRLPECVRGLVQSVKIYERAVISAALAGSGALAKLALMENPIIGQWDLAGELMEALRAGDPDGLGYLK